MLRFEDPAATKEVVIRGTTFVIGFWPPREAMAISRTIATLREKYPEGAPESDQANAEHADLHRHMVRYGLRSWKDWKGAPDPEAVLEKETIRGEECVRVPFRILNVLSLGTAPIFDLGRELLEWNNLTETEAKKSDVP